MSTSEDQQHHPQPSTQSMRQRNGRDKHSSKRRLKKQDTYFLCFPLVSDVSVPQLATSLAHFRNITSMEDDTKDDVDPTNQASEQMDSEVDDQMQRLKMIHPKAFRPPGTFHLTLGVMDLSRQEQMDKALALLRSIDTRQLLQGATPNTGSSRPSIDAVDVTEPDRTNDSVQETEERPTELTSLSRPISPPTTLSRSAVSDDDQDQDQDRSQPRPNLQPLTISLTGLSTFPNARSARVLYAKPTDPTTRLHDIAVSIRQRFRQAGLVTESRPLTLHATVSNLRYAMQKPRTNHATNQGQIDAREIVKIFDEQGGHIKIKREASLGEFQWARDVVIDQLAICKLGATKSDDPVLELEYPPIAARSLYEHVETEKSGG